MDKIQYIKLMHLRDRCVVFTDEDNKIRALATFVITNEPNNIIRNNIWDIPRNDNPEGKYVCVDRIISDRKQSIKEGMMNLTNYFNNHYPNKLMVWQTRRKNAEILSQGSIK